MFVNYEKLYNDIILKYGSQTRLECYCEYHHILPKCLGGKDDKANMIYVSGRVHVLLHWILCKIHPTNRKILHAFQAMTMFNGKQERILNTNIIESARKYNVLSRIGTTRSQETKEKISKSMSGRTKNEETKRKIGEATKKYRQKHKFTHSQETKEKLRKSHTGQIKNEETKRKIGDSLRGKKKQKVTCPHCFKVGGIPQMKQWHFDNCKGKNYACEIN
jgi:hypothetical protein